MLRTRFAPVHLHGRPCTAWHAAGGGPSTLRPSRVTCRECTPAARWFELQVERGQFAGGALVIFGFIFTLCAL